MEYSIQRYHYTVGDAFRNHEVHVSPQCRIGLKFIIGKCKNVLQHTRDNKIRYDLLRESYILFANLRPKPIREDGGGSFVVKTNLNFGALFRHVS